MNRNYVSIEVTDRQFEARPPVDAKILLEAMSDYLAFRTEEVDWEIWIAHGDHPYPCRYVITSKLIAGGPQYSIQVRDWKAGSQVAAEDFNFKNPTEAEKVDFEGLSELNELPKHFRAGGAQ